MASPFQSSYFYGCDYILFVRILYPFVSLFGPYTFLKINLSILLVPPPYFRR
jgi:hypothetical protein